MRTEKDKKRNSSNSSNPKLNAVIQASVKEHIKRLEHENRKLIEELKLNKFIMEAQSGTIGTLERTIQTLLKDSESDILKFGPFFIPKVNKKTPVNDTDVDKMTDDQINELIEKKTR